MECYDVSALYRLFKSLYSHIYQAYRGKKGETEFGYIETWNYIITTLVLLLARGTAPIHGTNVLRPQPTDEARKIVSLFKDTPHPVKWLVLEPGTLSS